MTYDLCIEFIESPHFTNLVGEYLTDDELSALQWHLSLHPESGDVVPGSGGLRKIRWLKRGSGKRGGLRVIYYYKTLQGEIWLLPIYSKNEEQNIPNYILKKIKEELIK